MFFMLLLGVPKPLGMKAFRIAQSHLEGIRKNGCSKL